MEDPDDDGIGPPIIVYPEPPPRRARGGLEADICRVFDLYASGELDTDGKPLTPHRVKLALVKLDGLTHEPSTGGISDAMHRMAKAGFIKRRLKPFGFDCYTPEGAERGWDAMRDAAKAA